MIKITITEKDLIPGDIWSEVKDPSCGGISVFVGTVRDSTKKKAVVRLEYESYEAMAKKEIEKIAKEAESRWPTKNISIHHRVGNLSVGEVSVAIAVATPHRQQSFEACQFIIDTLKEKVPIWKKEVFEDGEEWVSARP